MVKKILALAFPMALGVAETEEVVEGILTGFIFGGECDTECDTVSRVTMTEERRVKFVIVI